MNKNIVVFRNAADFRNYAADSGRNNAARALYRQILRLNDLARNEFIVDAAGLTVSADQRQQVAIEGKIYALSVNDSLDCRQFDADYAGLINVSPTTGSARLAFVEDLKLQAKPNLIRSTNNKPAYNAKMKADTFAELSSLKVWDDTTPEQDY